MMAEPEIAEQSPPNKTQKFTDDDCVRSRRKPTVVFGDGEGSYCRERSQYWVNDPLQKSGHNPEAI